MPWRSSDDPTVSPFSAGLNCRCPRCGVGALYDGLLQVRESCGHCGFDLGKADSGDGPAVFVIFILGALVVLFAIVLEFSFAPPLWVHMAIWPIVIVVGAIALLRPAKALLIALQFRNKAGDTGGIDYDEPR